MKLNSKSLTVKIWLFLALFSILIITFLWFFQVIFINTYYEWYKTNEINVMAKLVKNSYGSDNFEKILDEIYYKRGVCIELNDSSSILYSTDNMNRGCLVEKYNPSLVYYKDKFMESNETDITYKIVNEQLKSETLVYGLKLDDDLYAFLNTSIDPIDSTILILKNQLIIVTIIVLILSFVIGFYISKKISNPITSLNKSAKRLASGDYNVKFENQSDIEEIDELANTLNSARDALSKNDELRRELMANVSHDLKTPLTMIKAYAEMVRDITYKDKDKREENLNVIIEEVDRLNLLVGDILDLSKMQSNIATLNKEEFDLVELINTILNRYKIYTITENYIFNFTTNKKQIMIYADKKKMEQVIYNLINNAINYTGADNTVTIKVTDYKKNTKVEIIDTGKGIKKEELDKIWDKYYKSDKTHKRNMIGTGIGLSIVKNIFVLHDYEYGVISKKDKGSNFYFYIKKDIKKESTKKDVNILLFS